MTKRCNYAGASTASTTNVWKSQFHIGPTTAVNEMLTDATVLRSIELFDKAIDEVSVGIQLIICCMVQYDCGSDACRRPEVLAVTI
jgi:hypothetical protein